MKQNFILCVIILTVVFGFLHLWNEYLHEAGEAQSEDSCVSNLSQIGEGLLYYNTRHNSLPFPSVCNDQLPPEKQLSWYISVVPFLSSNDCRRLGDLSDIEYDKPWDEGRQRSYAVLPLKPMMCPLSPTAINRRNARGVNLDQSKPTQLVPTSYVGITGIGVDSVNFSKDNPKAGFFGYDRSTNFADIKDGASTTMAVAETSDLIAPWTAGGRATLRGLDPTRQPYIGKGRQFGGIHEDKALVLFADGSVRKVRSTIDPKIFEAIATIAGGEVVDAERLGKP